MKANGKRKSRKAGEPLADGKRERFAQQLAAGVSQKSALEAVNPSCRKWEDRSKRIAASRLANEAEIKERRDEILKEMIPDTVMKKTDLMVILSDEIREAAKEPGNVSAASALVDKFIKLMDWYPKQEVTIKNGGVSDNYTPPPAITQLDQATLKKLLDGTL